MARRLLFSLAFFAVLDLGTAWILNRFDLWPTRLHVVYSPVYDHDLRPGMDRTVDWGGRRYHQRTNSLGFMDASPREVPLESPRHRILVLGDSMTQGVGYPFEETFAGLVAAGLAPDGVEVLNAAVMSYSPSVYWRKTKYLLEEVGLRFDEVIVFLDISDIADEVYNNEVDAHGNVVSRMWPSAWWARVRELQEHSVVLRAVAIARQLRVQTDRSALERDPTIGMTERPIGLWTVDPRRFEEYGRLGLERAREYMDELLALLRERGIGLTLSVHPWPDQIVRRDRDSLQVSFWREWAAKSGVGFIDLFPVFLDAGEPREVLVANFIPGDAHLNGDGHRRVAEAVLAQLRARRPGAM
jgi:sugar phosphate isomerase/epimerase